MPGGERGPHMTARADVGAEAAPDEAIGTKYGDGGVNTSLSYILLYIIFIIYYIYFVPIREY